MALTQEQLEKLKEEFGGELMERPPHVRAGEGRLPGVSGEPTTARLPKFAGQPEAATPVAPKQELPQPAIPERQMAASPYEITDSTLTPEARARFEQQPTAPGTRMRSGPGYGTRPEGGWSPDYGRSMASSIAPPRSIGDIQRYQREVGEQERGFEQGMRLRQADIESGMAEAAGREAAIKGREAATREELAREETAIKRASEEAKTLSATKRQERINTLMAEYDNPETTPKRRAMIERQTAMLTGKNLPQQEREKGIIMNVVDPETLEESEKLVNPYTGEEIKPSGVEEGGAEQAQQTQMIPVADRVEGKTTHKIGDTEFVWSEGGWRMK